MPLQSASGLYRFSASCGIHFGTSYFLIRPTPASCFSVFLSGIRKLKNVFQVTQYKTFQILVQTFPEPWARGSPSVFHFRNRQRFQVPGFEWVHELLLFCLASNPAQFCAEISCGKTELELAFRMASHRAWPSCLIVAGSKAWAGSFCSCSHWFYQ